MRPNYRTINLGTIRIRLGPGKAFGSGEHETTDSCLEILGGLPDLKETRVLDVGCGTGILGIAALKLGASTVVAFDVDPDAIETTAINAALNDVSSQVTVLAGEIYDLDEAAFDLILANLYGDLILSSIAEMVKRLSAAGRLLLSGIKWEDRFQLEQEIERHGLTIEKVIMLEKYVTVLARGK